MIPILKFPRTPHLEGSRLQPGDEDLAIVAPNELRGRPLVVEEKLDGANCGISFDDEGGLILQSRGHVLAGGPRERQFALFKRWANHHRDALWEVLGPRYVLYGEWMYARHTIPYDLLTHYFFEFDMFDRETGDFLSTPRRRALLAAVPVVSVPVLASGPIKRLEGLLGMSRFATNQPMEGLYIKHEDEGRVLGRYKYVRQSFLQAIEEGGVHWMERPLEPNLLLAGVDLFASGRP
jgi:ATP-dependent RNA circularization protein (DNA/RNA ligase family)